MSVDPQDLRHAQSIAAQMVAKYGAEFLPAFIRLEREVAKLTDQEKAIERALKLCHQKLSTPEL